MDLEKVRERAVEHRRRGFYGDLHAMEAFHDRELLLEYIDHLAEALREQVGTLPRYVIPSGEYVEYVDVEDVYALLAEPDR